MLRVGCEIMIRMGFSNDPSKLPIVFQGAIASIQPGSELTFIAQGWGAELTNPIKDKHFGALSTVKHFGDLATAILNMSPGLRHFGSTYNLVEMIDDLSSVEFKGDIRKTWLARMKNLAVGLYGINPLLDHRDDNVWLVYNTAPTIWKEIIGGKGLGFDWVIQNKTAWEALNDILYYNPNYIIKILPYNEEDLQNLRSTLYIGPRDGYYQATDDHDPPSELFQNASQQYQTSRATWYLKTMNIEAKSVAELKALLLSEAGLDANTSPGGIVFNATVKQNSNRMYCLGKLRNFQPILFTDTEEAAEVTPNYVGYSRHGTSESLYIKRILNPDNPPIVYLYDIYDLMHRMNAKEFMAATILRNHLDTGLMHSIIMKI